MNYQKIILFLLVAFAISAFGWFLPDFFLDEDNLFLPMIRVAGYSWGPGLAAILVHRFIYGGSMARYGWNRKHFSLRWIALAVVAPVVLIVASLGMVFLLGNVMHLPGFGEIILGADSLVNGSYLSIPQSLASALALPPEIGGMLGMIITVGIISGTTVGLIWMSGQELGWRGFMLVETRSLGFLGSNLIIGILWGLWIFPMFLFQQTTFLPLLEVAGHLLSIVGFAVAMSFPVAWLAIRTRSIYASATTLGIFNNLAPIALFFTFDIDPRLGSPEGLAGMFAMLIVTFLIIRFDRGMTEKYDKWTF